MMTRQIATGYGAPSGPALEERISILEHKVNAMAEAILILTEGLEGTPLDGPGDDSGPRAARRAHELLITTRIAPRHGG